MWLLVLAPGTSHLTRSLLNSFCKLIRANCTSFKDECSAYDDFNPRLASSLKNVAENYPGDDVLQFTRFLIPGTFIRFNKKWVQNTICTDRDLRFEEEVKLFMDTSKRWSIEAASSFCAGLGGIVAVSEDGVMNHKVIGRETYRELSIGHYSDTTTPKPIISQMDTENNILSRYMKLVALSPVFRCFLQSFYDSCDGIANEPKTIRIQENSETLERTQCLSENIPMANHGTNEKETKNSAICTQGNTPIDRIGTASGASLNDRTLHSGENSNRCKVEISNLEETHFAGDAIAVSDRFKSSACNNRKKFNLGETIQKSCIDPQPPLVAKIHVSNVEPALMKRSVHKRLMERADSIGIGKCGNHKGCGKRIKETTIGKEWKFEGDFWLSCFTFDTVNLSLSMNGEFVNNARLAKKGRGLQGAFTRRNAKYGKRKRLKCGGNTCELHTESVNRLDESSNSEMQQTKCWGNENCKSRATYFNPGSSSSEKEVLTKYGTMTNSVQCANCLMDPAGHFRNCTGKFSSAVAKGDCTSQVKESRFKQEIPVVHGIESKDKQELTDSSDGIATTQNIVNGENAFEGQKSSLNSFTERPHFHQLMSELESELELMEQNLSNKTPNHIEESSTVSEIEHRKFEDRSELISKDQPSSSNLESRILHHSFSQIKNQHGAENSRTLQHSFSQIKNQHGAGISKDKSYFTAEPEFQFSSERKVSHDKSPIYRSGLESCSGAHSMRELEDLKERRSRTYPVSPFQVELRLHDIIRGQQEEKISELETKLRESKIMILSKEKELLNWKHCFWNLTKILVENPSDVGLSGISENISNKSKNTNRHCRFEERYSRQESNHSLNSLDGADNFPRSLAEEVSSSFPIASYQEDIFLPNSVSFTSSIFSGYNFNADEFTEHNETCRMAD